MLSLAQAVLTVKLQRFLSEEGLANYAESITLPHIDFAALKTAKKAKQTKRNCKATSISCGNSCQPKVSKSGKPTQCKDVIGEKGKQQADWLEKQVKSNKKASKQKPATQPKSKAGTVAELIPSDIAYDPQRFQYKIIGQQTKTGEVGSLSGVQKWDPNLAGIVQVWQDPADNKTYVVNGHNRLALANKLGADKVTVRYLDVKDAAEARAVGALTNIAEGRGTPLDAAKFFKDTGLTKQDLDAKGIPMREKIATDGIALSKLEDSLFRKTIDGDIPVERAVIIGGSGLDGAKQRDLVELIDKQAKRKSINNDVVAELIDGVKAADSQIETQFDLFGGSQVQVSNAIERATLQSTIKKKLSREKKLFGTVGKSTAAEQLASAGNMINVQQSQQVSQQASQALGIFDQLKNQSGGISKLLNAAATELQQGGDRRKIEAKLYKDILETIKNQNYAEQGIEGSDFE